MKQVVRFWVCTLQFFLLVTLQVRCIPESEGPKTLMEKQSKTPEGLLEAEKHALTASDNHKLGMDEFFQPSKHLIPFDKNHFDFNDEDWSVFVLPHSKEEQMIVSISPNVEKELSISTIIKAMSNIIITYQIHMTSNGASLKPTFSVFLITNGVKTLLKEETPQELWKTTSLAIPSHQTDSELQFVGILNDHANKIALRSFIVEDGATLVHHRYGAYSTLAESEDLLTGSESHGDKFFNDNDQTFHTEKFSQGLSKSYIHPNASAVNDDSSLHPTESSALPTTIPSIDFSHGGHDNSSYSSYNESTHNGHDYSDFENGNIDETIYDENVTDLHFPSSVTEENSSHFANVSFPAFTIDSTATVEAASNINATDSSDTESNYSVAKGVFNFFIVVIVCSIAVIGYLFWRRRKNQKEDEIPVFSRTSTEHGNPTFNDSEINNDVGINRDSQLNYRSIE